MSMEELMQTRKRLENKMNDEIQKALETMHSDLAKTNEMAAKHVGRAKEAEASEHPDVSELQPPPPLPLPQEQSVPQKIPPLIYFCHADGVPWSASLWDILVRAGYLVFDPQMPVHEQLGQKDIPLLDGQSLKVVKSMCPILQLPDEVLFPFDAVWKIFQKGDEGDNFSAVFRSLWFLARSSLVICDLSLDDPGSSQALLYAKQLGIPAIGVLPTSGRLHPWMHRSTTALFSGTDLVSLLPMIQGYAPL